MRKEGKCNYIGIIPDKRKPELPEVHVSQQDYKAKHLPDTTNHTQETNSQSN